MISYVDDFALTVASLTYRGNIRRLQDLFDKLERKASPLDVSFSVAKNRTDTLEDPQPEALSEVHLTYSNQRGTVPPRQLRSVARVLVHSGP